MDSNKRKKDIGKGGIMKIAFLGDNQEAREFEADAQDITEIFRMADKLSEKELAKLEKMINRLPIQKSSKKNKYDR